MVRSKPLLKQVSRGLQQLCLRHCQGQSVCAVDHGAHHPQGFVLIHAALLYFFDVLGGEFRPWPPPKQALG